MTLGRAFATAFAALILFCGVAHAETILYVNTASSAGGDCTTNATAGGNRACVSLLDAINLLPSSLSDQYTIYAEGSAADTSAVNQTPFDMTTTATNYLRIIGEQSPNHPNFSSADSGKYTTSKYRIEVTNTNALYNNIPEHIRIEGVQIQLTVSDASSFVAFKTSNQNQNATDIDNRMSHNICKAVLTSTGDVICFNTRFGDTGYGGTSVVYNNVAIDCTTGFNNDFDGGAYYNNTSADCEFGFIEDAAMLAVNNLSHGATIGFVGTFEAGSNFNAEDDGNGGPGANHRTMQTFTFVNAGADDFHLAAGDAGAKDFGTSSVGGLFTDDVDGGTRSGSWDIGADEQGVAFDPSVEEQEGFRWGVDDGNEAAHTFEANQDTNITIADNQSRLLRVLVNATDDPGSTAYTLRYQKNNTGGYIAVPVGATLETTPVIEAADATVTTVGTAADPWAINRPTGSTGDLMMFVLCWDDSTNTTAVTAPAGPNGETISSIVGPQASASTEIRMQAWYTVATGTWTSGTLSFDPNATETVRAVAIRVPAGEFESTPIGASAGASSAGTAESNVNSPAFSAGGTDGNGRLLLAFCADADAITVPASGTDTINNATGGAVGLDVEVRDTAVSDSESIAAITATIASDSWATLGFVVRAPIVNNEVYITTSANIAAGGEATTARLTAPAGKNSGTDFDTGRRWDDENGSDSIDITADDYTELEWLTFISSAANDGDFYDFRVYGGTLALDTYTVTPRWTIPSAAGGSLLLRRRRN